MQESQQRVQKLYQISQRQKEFLSESPLNQDGSSFCPTLPSTETQAAAAKEAYQAVASHPELKVPDPTQMYQNPLDNSMVSLVSTTRRSRQSRKLRSATASKQGRHEAPDSASEVVPKKKESPIAEAENENEEFSTVKKAADSAA